MELWDDVRNDNLRYLSVGMSAAQAEELAGRLRATRIATTTDYHEIEFVSNDKKIVFFVHPEDALNV